MTYTINARLELRDSNGAITWEYHSVDFEAESRSEAQRRFVELDSAVDEAFSNANRPETARSKEGT